MTDQLPNLQALALFVAVVDEGGLGAGARRLGMYQPNASRMVAQLEAQAGKPLLDRSPRGARPTSAGLLYAAHARELLEAAEGFTGWLRHSRDDDTLELHVGASMTIAEHLMPAWLTELRRTSPRVRVDLRVLNSTQVLEEIRSGQLQLGFIETPHVPRWVHAYDLREDELVVVVAPHHPWALRQEPVGLEELAATPLVVREGGSGTRDAFEELAPSATSTPPVQELSSNAAVRVAVASGAGPAVLSMLAVRSLLETGQLHRVPLAGATLRRPLTAVWKGPRRLSGPAADLVAVATAPMRPTL
ncbi:LysR family transcriptional regulator [Brachybacterium sacelli]|uniref:DNA-binding transcriptional LysR family regulator n=1 Tax=Brachybacterium sacelli TaxID=173364 RepID=A0ABS4X6F4_9MICO|nr:LysR family transcriptional regulator [Brachybacterium sacelli]MBP2384035.1 DNA-binding transcriptional LysR family regulator [Brachybacterium sacelli]